MKKIIALAAAILCGCAAQLPVPPGFDDLPIEARHAVSDVVVYDGTQLAGKRYEVLSVVEGESCGTPIHGRTATAGEAELLARYHARKLGADGITSLQCSPPKKTPACPESISCAAEAIRFLPR